MKLYKLIWRLFVLGLGGRFRQDIFVAVSLETPTRDLGITGTITGFDLADGSFLMIDAECEDGEPWAEEPPFIYDLIEASSLGTPEAKALRDSVPDEVVERIIALSRKVEAPPEVWIDDPLPGGYVCGAPDSSKPGGICGMPVEDEPCSIHPAQLRAAT